MTTENKTTQLIGTILSVEGRGITMHHLPSNCKLSVLDGTGFFLSGFALDAKTKEKFDAVLQNCYITVFIHVTTTRIKDFIVNNYETYYCETVPTGYTGGNQYHILIKNGLSKFSNKQHLRDKPQKDTTPIKEKLLELFKKRKRKNDIVEDILKLI